MNNTINDIKAYTKDMQEVNLQFRSIEEAKFFNPDLIKFEYA